MKKLPEPNQWATFGWCYLDKDRPCCQEGCNHFKYRAEKNYNKDVLEYTMHRVICKASQALIYTWREEHETK